MNIFSILQIQNGWEFLVKTFHGFLSKDQPPPTLQLQDLDPREWEGMGESGKEHGVQIGWIYRIEVELQK